MQSSLDPEARGSNLDFLICLISASVWQICQSEELQQFYVV